MHAPGTPGAVVLDVDGLTTDGVREVALTVRAGEIVGIAGVAGNGQSELVEALAGLRPVTSGRVRLRGEDVTHASATRAARPGRGVRAGGPPCGGYGTRRVRGGEPGDGPSPYVAVVRVRLVCSRPAPYASTRAV